MTSIGAIGFVRGSSAAPIATWSDLHAPAGEASARRLGRKSTFATSLVDAAVHAFLETRETRRPA